MAAPQTAVADTSKDGAFVRQNAVFRDHVCATGRYPAEGAPPIGTTVAPA
jgi:hypothetical protein